MNETTLQEKIKDFIGYIAWKVFLWAGNWTEETYSEAKYQDEKTHRENNLTP